MIIDLTPQEKKMLSRLRREAPDFIHDAFIAKYGEDEHARIMSTPYIVSPAKPRAVKGEKIMKPPK